MNNTGANQGHVATPHARSFSVEAHVASEDELALISLSGRLLFENGQSTEKIISAVDQLAAALGFRATVFPRWGDLTIGISDGSVAQYEIIAASPVGVDMHKVAATSSVIDDVCNGRLDTKAARLALDKVSQFPVSITRFALPCGSRGGSTWRDFRRGPPGRPVIDCD
jgi:uncharacterized membrane protein YjjP (DUF1212 family)